MEKWRKDARREAVIVDLDMLVPKNHLLRKIEKVMDYDWLYERLKGYYCHTNGRPGTAIGMAIVPLQPLIQPVVIHDLLDLTQQMILRHQHIQIHDHRFPPRVFSPLLHTKHPRFLYYTGIGGVWTSFLTG